MNPVVTPKFPKWWLKTGITFCVAFRIFVAGNRKHFKFGMINMHTKFEVSSLSHPEDILGKLKI